MAESHSEDSPLLGGTDPPSPGECSPGPRSGGAGGVVPNWSSSFRTPEEGASACPPSDGRLSAPSGAAGGAAVDPPKQVHSQTSMDSGCDCDPSDTEGPPHLRGMGAGASARGDRAPSLSRAGPSAGRMAPLAQKESLDCQCGAVDQKCVCETEGVGGGGGAAAVPPACHTDRGELPKVSFRIEGYDDEDDDDVGHDQAYHRLGFCSSNVLESSSQSGSEPGEDFRILVKGATMTFPKVTSIAKSGMLSASSSTASMPMCRICHFPQGEDPDTLISPCRCSGTMQFIHESCLMKWLDVSKSKKAAACELCNYQYNRHKKFRLRHWELPSCSRLDKILHSIFLLCLIIMATCATITIYCFKQDRFTKKREGTDLTKSEIVTLTCGVLFFVAFFLAMYVEVKAKDTLYRLFSRFLRLNQTWHIDEYDKQKDNQHAPV